MSSAVIRNATILTMDDRWTIVEGSLAIRDGVITAVGDVPEDEVEKVLSDLTG